MSRNDADRIPASAPVGDEVKCTTCYMCACRCGIRVHLKDGSIRYIEGNREHPVNHGVLCAKGAAGIMQQYSPARLRKPLRRIGPRGSGEFAEIEWEEALATASGWLSDIRADDPRRLAFFTGRDQSQSLTGYWASQFGTPNYAAHGGFCSVNMAAAGLYTIGGSFWEFGEPDWERCRYFLMFGVAEDHDSNPIKIGLGKLKTQGAAKFVSVNPVRTGYSAIADEWLGIRPGTDGLFVQALIHELMAAGRIDLDYLRCYTNACWLLHHAPGTARDGLFVRGADGQPQAWDRLRGLVAAKDPQIDARLHGEQVLPDGGRAVPVFQRLAERYLDPSCSPEAAAAATGIAAGTIRRIAAELAHAAFEQSFDHPVAWTDHQGQHHSSTRARPVAMHAMRGISAHSNGFHTCRAIHILQLILGSVDCPGGFRFKPPYPKISPPAVRPAGKPGDVIPGQVLPGPPLGFVAGPEDLLIEEDGTPQRIDKAYSWEAPLAAHGLMHMVIANAWRGDPYPIDTLFLYMANMGWNSAMNTQGTLRMLTDRGEDGEYRIPHIILSDAFFSETVPYADLVLPDTTYFERWDCISLLDRPISTADGPADAIRQPVLTPDRDVRPFQDVLIELGARLALPAFTRSDGSPRFPGGYPDYLVNHERCPGTGPLAGWRGPSGAQHGSGAPNPEQLQRYIDNGCFWQETLPETARFYRFANRDYLAYARRMNWTDTEDPLTMQLYCEPLQKFRLAAQGHGRLQPPQAQRQRIARFFDPLPIWYPPLEEEYLDTAHFPLHAITQRPMAMYHSWGSQNAWSRQIHGWNDLYLHRDTAAALDLADGDWAWVESPHGRIKAAVRTMEGCEPGTVWTWNAIGKRRGAWRLDKDAPEARRGFLLNHLIADLLPARNGVQHTNSDPVTGQAAWYDLRVRLVKAAPGEPAHSEPQFPVLDLPGGKPLPAVLRYDAANGPRTGRRRRR